MLIFIKMRIFLSPSKTMPNQESAVKSAKVRLYGTMGTSRGILPE